MKSISKLLCVMCCVLVGSAATANACGRCGYNLCRFTFQHVVAPKVVEKQKLLPAPTDRSFHVTYNVTFPAPAVAGSTGFAYTPPQYSFLDPALFVNAASRYLDTAQLASQKGFSEFNQSSALVLGQQANVAELQARAALVQEMSKLLASTTPSGSVQLQLRASRDKEGRIHIEGGPVPKTAANVQQIISQKCVSCHAPGNKQGGLDLSNLAVLDRSYEAKILDRITTADRTKRMPKDGTLSAVEIVTFFRASSLCGGTEK